MFSKPEFGIFDSEKMLFIQLKEQFINYVVELEGRPTLEWKITLIF